jgi:hypothetical protein
VVLVLILAFMISCRENKQKQQWDTADIDTNLNKNPAFSQLDNQVEIFSAFMKHDTTSKRTSAVYYFTKGHVNLQDSNSARLNHCTANFSSNDDKLSINIGIGNGFGAYGFIINYKNKKFYTKPYYTTDSELPDKTKPSFKVLYQKLILDKSSYKPGDSLYGKINFKTIEIDKNGNKIDHSGNGYFRTIVRKL